MYLFIFFWSPALKSARVATGNAELLPYGMIFASFMCMMMLGSILFSSVISAHDLQSSSQWLLMVVAVASSCLQIPVLAKTEGAIFWAFCMFEGCVGVYFPSMAYLKGKIVDDRIRAKVYSLLRLPLNIFVVVALSLTQEGMFLVFRVCSVLLKLTR